MYPAAPVPVRAGSGLEEEGAVHLVLLRPEYAGQVLRHVSLCLLTTIITF